LASTIIVRPSSSSFLLPARDVAGLLVGQMADRQELQHLVGLARQRAFLFGGDGPAANHAFHSVSPGLAGGTIIRFSRTVIEPNSCAIWKVRSKALVNSSCGGRPVMSSPVHVTGPGRRFSARRSR
jgi:hypothetical protein